MASVGSTIERPRRDDAGVVGRVECGKRSGALPPVGGCAICGRATDELMTVRMHGAADCPAATPDTEGMRHGVWSRIGRWLQADAPRAATTLPPVGPAIVDVPLRMHAACWHAHPERATPRGLRMLVQIVPLYNELLAAYPNARLEVIEPAAG